MHAQREARRVLGLELAHQPRPQQPGGAQFRDLHEEIHADAEKERQPRREFVDRQAARQRGAHVFEPIGQSKCQLLNRGRAGFLHVIAGDRDRIEFRHVAGGVFDDVGDDAHRRPGRVDIGVADHELLQDVVLDRAREPVLRHALLLGGDDVAGQDRQDRAVHRHRHAHFVERDAGEQDFHVLDRIDRHTGLADVARDPRMVAVVAAMGGEIEGDRQPHLPGREVFAIEMVRVLGGRKARILPDRPRPVGVHRRPRATQIGREAGHRVFQRIAGRGDRLEIGGGVERLESDALGGGAVEAGERLALELGLREPGPIRQGLRRKGAVIGHAALPHATPDLYGRAAAAVQHRRAGEVSVRR